jgi:predicted RNase H-like nuclease (RuvC/YqgF family)
MDIITKIITLLKNRKGFDGWWDSIGKEIQLETLKELQMSILARESELEDKIEELEDKIEELESELEDLQDELDDKNSDHSDEIDELEEDITNLQDQIDKYEFLLPKNLLEEQVLDQFRRLTDEIPLNKLLILLE